MKEVKFLVKIDEGNARYGYADWVPLEDEPETFIPGPKFFDTYEEAHAHMHELSKTTYKGDNELLLVDVEIVGDTDVISTRRDECTCSKEVVA